MFTLALAVALTVTPQTVVSIHRRLGRHTYSVRLVAAPFRAHGRKFVWVKVGSGSDPYLPGYRTSRGEFALTHGYEPGYTPFDVAHQSAATELAQHDEIRSMTITVDGRRWPVQSRLIRDLLDPHTVDYELLTTLSADGRTLVVREKGSVHGSAYWVKWTFHRDGRQTRSDDDGPRLRSVSVAVGAADPE